MSSTVNLNTKIILKRDWYAQRLNAFPETKEELMEKVDYFPIGTVFEDFGAGGDKYDLYGWCYKKGDTWHYAHMHAALKSWRSFPEMFEEYHNV